MNWIALTIVIALSASAPQTRAFRECGVCPEMVVIPAGSFTIGSPRNEPGHDSIEEPSRRITVRQFAAGEFEVTRGQWAAFATATHRADRSGCAWTGRTRSKIDPSGSWRSLGFQQNKNHPVVCVTWYDAKDYVRWLSRMTHHEYRLMTESEWEYAARAGTTTPYPWGTIATHERANFGADVCCSGSAAGRDKWLYTSPVNTFAPNAFGLYDMSGNVLQWLQGCFSANYDSLPANGTAYEKNITLHLSGQLAQLSGTKSCAYRMLRGGDWGDPPVLVRSAARNFAPEQYASGGVGFRVAETLRRAPK